jgi:hypothetical protein
MPRLSISSVVVVSCCVLQCKGPPIYCKHASIRIETHETVFVIVLQSNWMIIGVIGSIEYEPEASKQPVMSQS